MTGDSGTPVYQLEETRDKRQEIRGKRQEGHPKYETNRCSQGISM